jgi:iron complex outermembrane receptor protein
MQGLELAWQAKYVGEQYVDNSGEANRKLGAYQLNDLRIEYRRPVKAWFEEVRLALLINNVFDLQYVSNGYVYPYLFNGSLVNELYVYPQAGRNFMVNLYFGF